MTTTNEKLRNVAEIAAKIMMGEKALHPNQQKLDVHEPEKDELTADDFKKLRAGKKAPEVKKEEVAKPDFLDLDKDGDKKEPMKKASSQMKKEEAEQVDEAEIVKTATGMRVYGSSYGDSAKARRDQVKKSIDTAKGPKMKDLSDIEAEKKKKKKMSEMVATYQEQGLKGLFATLVKEEPTSAEFDAESKVAQDKSQGTGKKAEVTKAAVQAVQSEEFEVVMDELNGYAEATIEERSMTEPEMKKKEEIVKSMKKGISGFKARYGKDAKSVMYATATKRAMGEEVEQINEAITHGDYIITHKPYNGTDKQRHVSNDITHAYSTNQKKLGIKHSEDDDEIGPDRHITVKNKKTGEVSHHVATHNNSYKDEGEKQKISIRAHSEVTPHDEKHAKVIKSFLTQKS